jgi:hypothetical protein
METDGEGRALVVEGELAGRWTESGLLDPAVFHRFTFGRRKLTALISGTDQMLCPVFR